MSQVGLGRKCQREECADSQGPAKPRPFQEPGNSAAWPSGGQQGKEGSVHRGQVGGQQGPDPGGAGTAPG